MCVRVCVGERERQEWDSSCVACESSSPKNTHERMSCLCVEGVSMSLRTHARVCVCEREREKEKETVNRKGQVGVHLCVCVRVCVRVSPGAGRAVVGSDSDRQGRWCRL